MNKLHKDFSLGDADLEAKLNKYQTVIKLPHIPYFKIEVKGKFGLLDMGGQEIIPCIWDDIRITDNVNIFNVISGGYMCGVNINEEMNFSEDRINKFFDERENILKRAYAFRMGCIKNSDELSKMLTLYEQDIAMAKKDRARAISYVKKVWTKKPHQEKAMEK